MSRDDQTVSKAEQLVERLVDSLLLHSDLEPSNGSKESQESNEPPLTSDDGQGAYQKAKDWGSQAKDWVLENPGQAGRYAVVAGSLAVIASPALVSAPLLATVGFGGNGVVANSIAAGIQSGIGNVVAHSSFATLTSAGMGGYGAAIVNGVVQTGAGAAAVTSGGCFKVRGWFGGGDSDEQDSDEKSSCPSADKDKFSA